MDRLTLYIQRLPWLVVMEGAIWKAKVGFPRQSSLISQT